MTQLLRIILPVYLIIYFALAFVVKIISVRKKIGKNPLVMKNDDSTYGVMGLYFRVAVGILLIYILVYAFFPAAYPYFLPVTWMEHATLQYIGLSMLAFSLIWTITGQNDMRHSWRIGIDTDMKTDLITTGLFRFSRNPIYLGLLVMLIGLFLAAPNAVSLLYMVLCYFWVQVQIRLEEEHLHRIHGEAFADYKRKVRRLI